MTTTLLAVAAWAVVTALLTYGWHRLVTAHKKGPRK